MSDGRRERLVFRELEKGDHENEIPGDCHMTIAEFGDSVEAGAFTDDDGFGEWATETKCSNQAFAASDFARMVRTVSLPEWATHVVWYNK